MVLREIADRCAVPAEEKVTVQPPRRNRRWCAEAENALGDADARQRLGQKTLPTRCRLDVHGEHPVTLVAIEGGKIERRRQVENLKLDPVLQGVADDPASTVMAGAKAVPEARTQPGEEAAFGRIDKDDQHEARRHGSLLHHGSPIAGLVEIGRNDFHNIDHLQK